MVISPCWKEADRPVCEGKLFSSWNSSTWTFIRSAFLVRFSSPRSFSKNCCKHPHLLVFTQTKINLGTFREFSNFYRKRRNAPKRQRCCKENPKRVILGKAAEARVIDLMPATAKKNSLTCPSSYTTNVLHLGHQILVEKIHVSVNSHSY